MQITSNLPNTTVTKSLTKELKLEVDSVIKSMQICYPSSEWDNYTLDDVLQSMMFVDIINFKEAWVTIGETWGTIGYDWRTVFSKHFLGLLMGNRMFEISNLLELEFLDVVANCDAPEHVVVSSCLELSFNDSTERNNGLVKQAYTCSYKNESFNLLINKDETYIGKTDVWGANGITLLNPEAKFETALEYLSSITPQDHCHYYLRNGKWETLYMTEQLDTLDGIDIFVHRGHFSK